MKSLAWGAAAAGVISLFAVGAAADVFTCVGPAGEILYSNLGCPPGYSVRENTPETDTDPDASTPAAPAAEPLPTPEPVPPPVKAAVDERCSAGTFQTDEGPGAIDVHFTNSSSRACRKVRFYCLWGLGFGMDFYRQSGTGSFEGLVEAGATVHVGEMKPSGPRAGDVSWSWCRIR